MKRKILLITIVTATLLLLPMLLFAAPKDYLGAEGSSLGIAISQEAQTKARAGRLLRYQNEIDKMVSENPQASEQGSPMRMTSANTGIASMAEPATDSAGGLHSSDDAIGGTTGTSSAGFFGGGSHDITPSIPNTGGEVTIVEVDDPIITDPGGNDAGGTDTGTVTISEELTRGGGGSGSKQGREFLPCMMSNE